MFKVVYSNNMVQLAAHLAELQQSQPLPPLEAETVIVQSNELTRWLSLFLAQSHGVVSHIDFPYPSAYIWALFRKLLPNIPKQSSFSTDAMTWRLFELLPACRKQTGFESIDAYLGQVDEPLKRYGLAHRIADTFDQYLMYRPDWIQAWERGDKPHWQAMLWQQLTDGEEIPMHRANLLVQLQEYLSSTEQRPAELPSRMAIFGISALPPVYLDLFKLMARHCDVTLYFLSPSEEYWGDLVDQKTQTQRLIDSPEQADYLVSGHPLLASLGKQGQEFFDQLQDTQPEEESLFMPVENEHLLGLLQQDIYTLRDSNEDGFKQAVADDDDSIMVHSCHSAMREIEVLHDQLLALFERHPELSPTDIVVMTPDIALYTPWIDAVFSCASKEHSIPYGIADAGLQRQSPVLSAFSSLLDLPQSRFDVETVMALLDCPAIQKRFSLYDEQIELIRTWLRDTQTRWGLSSEDKAGLGLPEVEANTWRAGLDRLLLGYAMPLNTGGENWGLFDNKLGFDGISGERAETMAQLCAFVDRLDKWRKRLKGEFDAVQWQQHLLRMLDDFFVATAEQGSDEAELLVIRKSLDALVETTELAQFDNKMRIDLVEEWLNGHFDSSQALSRFMGHGVTFCGMVPMRSIPFPVVCLIGMNDESYPRRQPTAGFDLLSSDFRKGDRSRRDDDRYLFLESLLSAQSHLYISYVGSSISDNAPIPPSVLVSDLRDVLRQGFEAPDDDNSDIWQHVLIQHPLQAFSRRYFDRTDARLFSYVTAHCPPGKSDINTLTHWFEKELTEPEESWKNISLNQLLKFFSHPARYLLQERLGLRLETDDDQLETREPFALDGLQAWSLRQQLLTYRLQDKDLNDALSVIKATGVLPQGQVGEKVFADQSDKVEEFTDKLLPDYPDEFLTPFAFDYDIDNYKLVGQLEGLSEDGLFNYQMGKTKGNHLLNVWIRHLLLNCLKPKGVICESRLITENNDYTFQMVEDAKDILNDLLNLYWNGLKQPLNLFPNTSYAFAQASLNGGRANPETAMNNAWQGNQFLSGEGEDLYYQQLYTTPPLDEKFKELALAIYEPLQAHLVGGKL
ncbi:MAG: exodeoxyribonuclease V subunit gamma [Gammaproteobacteria bacterium]|nr:exodeoxyribonuclease V subunit gamma [Gammaproteobacteria bacterium]